MTFAERRRPVLTAEPIVRVAIVWLVVATIFLALRWSSVEPVSRGDMLHMLQLRDLFSGQGWFDLAQHRLAPPQGAELGWSRLGDLPAFVIEMTLRPVLGDGAARTALALSPLLALLAVMLLAGRVAWVIFDGELVFYAAFLVALATPLASAMKPYHLGHEGWQVAALLLAANGLTARSARAGGWTIGLALAAMVTLGLETLPLALLMLALLARRWVASRGESGWLIHGALALFVGATGLFYLTRGTSLPDPGLALGPAWLAGFAVLAAGCATPTLVPNLPRLPLLLSLLLAFATAIMTVGLIDPGALRAPASAALAGQAPFALLGQSPAAMAQAILPPLIGTVATLALWGRAQAWLRGFWSEWAILLVGATTIAIVGAGQAAPAWALAVVPLAWQVRHWHRAAQRVRDPSRRLAAFAAIAAAVVPGLPLLALAATLPGQARAAAPAAGQCSAAGVRLGHGNELIYAAPALGTEFLAHSGHAVVAVDFWRQPAGAMQAVRTLASAPDRATDAVRASGAGYLILCPSASVAPGSLAEALLKGLPLPHLTPVPVRGNLRAWRLD